MIYGKSIFEMRLRPGRSNKSERERRSIEINYTMKTTVESRTATTTKHSSISVAYFIKKLSCGKQTNKFIK